MALVTDMPQQLVTTYLGRLHRRARLVSIRTEHAAITCLGLEHGPTAFAVIKELAGISGHRFHLPVTALSTSDRRGEIGHGVASLRRKRIATGSQISHVRAASMSAVPVASRDRFNADETYRRR